METNVKRTPLSTIHEALGARMMEFGGWWMPVQYAGILEEHKAVRSAAGLFDISHMGELVVSGSGAAAYLNRLLTNDIRLLTPGKGQYSLMLNERGGVIDDLILYKRTDESFFLIVNASKIEEDFAWMQSHLPADVILENQSGHWAGLALQGPRAEAVLTRLLGADVELPRRNQLMELQIANGPALIARTGYTGEDGFEWFCPAQSAVFWWERILEAGADLGLLPCGLGARDTLRLEACFPLNGSDLSPEHTPLEAGLSRFVKFEKGDFIGKASLEAQAAVGVQRTLSALVMQGKTPPPRPHYPVVREGKVLAETTSGTLSPTLGLGIALAYLPTPLATPGTEVAVEIRGRQFPALVAKRPLYRRPE